MTKPGKICSIQDDAYRLSTIDTEIDVNDKQEIGRIIKKSGQALRLLLGRGISLAARCVKLKLPKMI